MRKTRFRGFWGYAIAAGLIVMASLALAACGGSDGGSSSGSATNDDESTAAAATEGVDVGTGTPIPVGREELKLAFVASGLSSPAGASQKRGVEKIASKYNIPVEVFDGQFDPARQFSLFRNVVEGGKYNAVVTVPLSGDQSCEILSKTAPSKDIIVSIMIIPICGRDLESANGDGLWQPGTLDTVGITTNKEGLENVAETCKAETGGGETILLNGQSGSPNYEAMTDAFESAGFDIVANYATNYAPSEALEKTSAALLSNPNLKVIATTSPLLVQGATQALKSAGKAPGAVKMCNIYGGSEQMMNLIRSGELTVDAYANTDWVAMAAVQSIVDATEGKPIPRVSVPGPNGTIVKSGTEDWPPPYTKKTVDQFEPNGD